MRSRISSKGQITVPLEVRDRLGLEPGTAVEFLVREGEAVIRKRQKDDPIDRVYGRLTLGRDVDAVLDEMRGPAHESTKPKPKPKRRRRR